MTDKMTFSGHDTFHCRLFWLKKGYDYVSSGDSFRDNSGVELGVGRNMVNSIRFYLKAFGIIDQEKKINPLFDELFKSKGWDPFLENEATLYLLHYFLCAENYSSSYNIIFRELRKIKPEFSRSHFVNLVQEKDPSQNQKILEKDFSVFLRNYSVSKSDKIKEEGYSGILSELSLLHEIGKNKKGDPLYRIENKNQEDVPYQVILYCILINLNYGDSISFNSLYSDEKGLGNIFCLDQDVLEEKLIEISQAYDFVTYNSEAGVKEIQFKNKPEGLEILRAYYEN
ncbi:DUF4007 family protein [Zunongwangia sp. F363]|uniref:DUF4007 family protein n=1 Tax=Autumnicola tepida TaxID=3075595 RepID=A0ABU3C748_9FLAO|nr:DUF4007 family protein [Zunongwangia sp. F363]MDT0642170.1 DUF4007 family protein [Zunongwangia sp. F363]